MANTTFNGPVRSENGFEVINTNSTTGAVTTTLDIDSTGAIANPTGMIAATGAKTQMANGFSDVMVKNTHYIAPADGNACTATLPTAATSTAGSGS